jgi:hypothetical protein
MVQSPCHLSVGLTGILFILMVYVIALNSVIAPLTRYMGEIWLVVMVYVIQTIITCRV